MTSYSVRCTTAAGEDVLVTVEANSSAAALAEVKRHVALFYGPGDAAGSWLAGRNPDTLVRVHGVQIVGSVEDLRDCPNCEGSGEIHWNPSPVRDPQCEESAPCGRCTGSGAVNELPASCAPERGHSEGVLSPRLASVGNRTDPSGGFLERCPACGCEDDRAAFEGWEGWPDVDGSSKFVVRCPKCEALHPDQTQHEDASADV